MFRTGGRNYPGRFRAIIFFPVRFSNELIGVFFFFCLLSFYPQYNLDFQGLSTRSGAFGDRGEDGSGAGSGGEGGKMSGGSGSDGSMWQFGMGRRSKGDGRRTRVSFLLFWARANVRR